ncbi:MAG: ribonuclease HII [Chitinophagales bacterium]|nr:ribonuclease HII [Chitinophagales bacterium]
MLASFYKENSIEAGCDEAGRGCLAGPVVAAAVVLPTNFSNEMLNDSKQINEKNRNLLRTIIEQQALSYAVAFVDNDKIDEINILKASIYAMHLALDKLKIQPEHIIIDGNKFYPYQNIPFKTIVKGDAKYASIAAASILAKTYRDEFMLEQAKKYPNYLWENNKGYPTKAHREAIAEHGACPLHRKSFRLLKDEQMELF